MYTVTNPATGEVLEQYSTATDGQMREAIDRAHTAFGSWKERTVADRAEILAKAAALFLERSEELAGIITLEMGKRISEARGEVKLASAIFTYYAQEAERMLADEPLPIKGGRAVLQKRPVGVLIGIMPWNFPYYQSARFVAPNACSATRFCSSTRRAARSPLRPWRPCCGMRACRRTPLSTCSRRTSRSPG